MGVDLRAHSRVGIDTSLFIYHLESNPAFHQATRRVFDQIHAADIEVIASVITITELLTKPFRYGSLDKAILTETMLSSIPSLTFVDVTRDIARDAAKLRGRYGFRTPDAIQVATAVLAGATAFLTNDLQLRRVQEIEVFVLSDFVQ